MGFCGLHFYYHLEDPRKIGIMLSEAGSNFIGMKGNAAPVHWAKASEVSGVDLTETVWLINDSLCSMLLVIPGRFPIHYIVFIVYLLPCVPWWTLELLCVVSCKVHKTLIKRYPSLFPFHR